MKKTPTFRELLGFSQEELALLLQVSRSQIAMYESGKRNLPIIAIEKLAVMLAQSKKANATIAAKKNCFMDEQKFLEKLLLKNAHQQLIMDKKIIVLEKKQN